MVALKVSRALSDKRALFLFTSWLPKEKEKM